jgi:tetratricopeptide (TPR) repeat protein
MIIGLRFRALIFLTPILGAAVVLASLYAPRLVGGEQNPAAAQSGRSREATVREQEAKAAFERAVQFMNDGKLADAIREFDQAIKLYPTGAFLYDWRGDAHARMGQLDHAIEDYSEAIRLKPGLVEAYHHRASTAEVSEFLGGIRLPTTCSFPVVSQ